MKKESPQKFKVYTIEEWQEKFEINTRIPRCVVEDVPISLRPIVSYANKWAVRCDVSRHALFQAEGEVAVAAFYNAVCPYKEGIEKWIDTLPRDTDKWHDTAFNYLFLLKALSEAYQPTKQELQEIESRRLNRRNVPDKQKVDMRTALKAYREGNYKLCRELLSKYEDRLEGEVLNKYNKCKEMA